MDYIDLKEGNLEKILRNFGFSKEEVSKINKDANYYDRYILVKEGSNIGFLTVLRQPFGDPYLYLTLDECDLINYKGKVSIKSFLDTMDDIFQIPQVTRCSESNKEAFERKGFKGIGEKEPKYANASRLIPIKFEIKDLPTIPISQYIRPTDENDLTQITNLFAKEYPLRSRIVKRMYEMNPTSCFVYEEKGVIDGVIFGEQIADSNTLYIHQLLVKKSEQGKRIDRALLNYVVGYARKNNLTTITATIRGNFLLYYLRLGAVIDYTAENEQYLVRFEIQR